MGYYKAKDFIDAYRFRAGSSDPNDMSGRNGQPAITQYISQKICETLNLQSDDILVDVGCGDGSVLKIALNSGLHKKNLIGVLPSIEEVRKVNELLGFEAVVLGISEKTSLPSAIADKVVCNGVFLLLSDKEAVKNSLVELSRIAKKGSLVLVGEMPHVDEQVYYQTANTIPVTLNILQRVKKVFTQYGPVEVLNRLYKRLKNTLSREVILISPSTTYSIDSKMLCAFAEEAHLKVIKVYPSPTTPEDDSVKSSSTRLNYLFERV